ncbi:hypothetical protein KR054_008287 [Drosophila jambulina]|nr:hypothetical protein KR054_008287 [Drosophila jambulina]
MKFNIMFIIILLGDSDALFKLNNIKCNCYDRSFCEFRICQLKVLGRGKVGLSIHVKVHQLPINNSRWAVTLFRRLNGYKPFLFNMSVDVCQFFRHKKRHPFFNMVYEGFRNFSNVNHTCPYNHDLVVDRMVLDDKMISKAPVPNGFYKLSITVQTEGVGRGEIDVHAEVNLGFD